MADGLSQSVLPFDAISILEGAPHVFLQPTPQLHSSFLQLAKHYLDPLAADISAFQDARKKLQRSSKKRKRRDSDDAPEKMLKMRRVFVDGFEVGQVWQQVREVLDATGGEVERTLPDDEDYGADKDTHGDPSERARLREDGSETEDLERSGEEDDGNLGEEGIDWEDEDDGAGRANSGNDRPLGDDLRSDEGSLDIGEETPPSEISDEDGDRKRMSHTLVKDKFGLNDGFFSIDEFNKQSQFLEQADARGEDDGAASDEEDIDWTADPTSMNPFPAQKNLERSRESSSKNVDDSPEEEDEDDEDEEGGPVFRNMDLDAPEGESDPEDASVDEVIDASADFSNTNAIAYADFFAPPAQAKSSKKRKTKAPRTRTTKPDDPLPYGNALALEDGRDDEVGDIERAMSAVQRDLFDEEENELSGSEAEADLSRSSVYAAHRNLSSHEKRQLALREEIRKLEAANVAPKPWSLTGESLAPARPINSLLEEDLDFERAGKPVPVVTNSVNEDIEALIKRRIIAREFDEVIRRRPTDLVTGHGRRGRVEELSDTKPQKGLAEEYEDEHLRKTDPNYVDPRSEALKNKHADIEKHWKAISSQLDALCNWHYKPRPPEASLDVRVDVPRIAMEEARPSGGGEGAGESVLAPQEIYRAGEEGRKEGEVMTKGGLAVAKEEETREQKKRRRMREKERNKKANGNAAPKVNSHAGKKIDSNKRAPKVDVVGQLKKGGVRVIDKKGELRDVEGKAVHEKSSKSGGGSFKL